MERKSFLVTMFLISITSFCQEKFQESLPLENGKVVYTEVIKIDDLSKSDLYKRAKKWVVLNYKSANDVIQLDDKEDGIIIAKGTFGIRYYTRNPKIEHTLQIETKNGRFKYTISNFIYNDNQGYTFFIENFPKGWAGKKKLYRLIDEEVNKIISNLKQSMNSEEKDDW